MNESGKLEAILFVKGEPVRKTELMEILGTNAEDLQRATEEIIGSAERGITILDTGDSLQLVSAAVYSEIVSKIESEDEDKALSRAAEETLSIVAYFGPVSKQQIDQIRGINSIYVLRALMIRGLIERVADLKNRGHYLYQPTSEFMSRIGVSRVCDLPDFEGAREILNSYLQAQKETNE